MSILMWGIAAVVAGIGATALGFRYFLKSDGPPAGDEPLPPTALQRLAGQGFVVASVLSALLVGLVLYVGPTELFENDAIRIGFTLGLVAILVVFAYLTLRMWQGLRRNDGTIDERDRAILNGSQSLRSGAILLTLAIWILGLTERFHDAGAVPVYYLNLVFWSCIVVSLLALPLGVLIGYRRA